MKNLSLSYWLGKMLCNIRTPQIVHFNSGLGNQIFQYMFYCWLCRNKHRKKIYGYYNKKWLQQHNGLEIHKVFDIQLPPSTKYSDFIAFVCRALHRLDKKGIFFSSDDNFNPSSIYFSGYWQDKKFYINEKFSLRFRNVELNKQNSDIKQLILKTNSVSLHVRRGDYLQPVIFSKMGNICTKEYYSEAMKIINEKMETPVYFIFSDDCDWAKKNLFAERIYYVDWNIGTNSFIDMYLMSLCKGHIIANSSFSYWGAYLSQKNVVTVYPKRWYNDAPSPDIAANSWISI